MSTGLATTNITPTTLEGDVTGTTAATEVVGIQNTPIINTPVAGGDGSFLGVATSGTSLEWLPVPPGFTAGQDLSGTSTAQTVIGIQDYTISNSPEPGYSLVVATSGATLQWEPGGGINYTQPPPTDVGSYLPYQPGSSEDFYTLLNEITGNPYIGFSEVSVAAFPFLSGLPTGPSDYTIVGANIAVAQSGTYVSGTGTEVAAITFIGDALAQIRAFTSQTTQSGGNPYQIENPEGASIQVNGNGNPTIDGQPYGLNDIEFTGGMAYWSQCYVNGVSDYYVDTGTATDYLASQERYDGNTYVTPIDDYIINVGTSDGPITIHLPNYNDVGIFLPKQFIITDAGGYAATNPITIEGLPDDTTATINVNGGSLTIQNVFVEGEGTSWQVIGNTNASLSTIGSPITIQTGNYTTVAGSDYNIFVDTATAASPITITLQSNGANGTTYYVKDYSGAAATYNITVVDYYGLTIDGASSYVINLNYACVGFVFYTNGIIATWSVISAYNGTVV